MHQERQEGFGSRFLLRARHPANMYCMTVRRPRMFMDLTMERGYDLFLDRGRLKSTFFKADLLRDSDALDKLECKFDIVFAAAIFHLFDWDKQMKIARQCVKLLCKKPRSSPRGHHLGHIEPGHHPSVFGSW